MELDIDSVLKERKFFQKIKCGDDGKKDTPVPISNTEVKLLSADSSWGGSPCEGRTLPRFIYNGGLAQLGEHLPYKQRVSGSIPLTSIVE